MKNKSKPAHLTGCYTNLAVLLFALALLGGCATYDPNDYYDPNAVEKVGRISAKTVARTVPARSGETSPPIFLPLKGMMVIVPGFPTEPAGLMNIYEYVVTLAPNQTVSVFSEYPSFNVGDCAKVFLSQRASYPRIASGSGCEKKDATASE